MLKEEELKKIKNIKKEEKEEMKNKYYKFPNNIEEVRSIVVEENENNKIIIIDYFTNSCTPCKFLDNILLGVFKYYEDKGIKDKFSLLKINLDNDNLLDLAVTFGIKAIPTLMFIKNSELQKVKMKDDDGEIREHEILVGLKEPEVYVSIFNKIMEGK